MLYVHAIVQPLDYYELVFVTPITSIVMFTICGFLLGLLFALALRNDPSAFKRGIRIFFICFFISVLYSVSFVMSSLVEVIVQIADDAAMSAMENGEVASDFQLQIIATLFSYGDIALQIALDALLMTVLCIVGYLIARKTAQLQEQENFSMRTLFSAWLLVVVFLAFLLTATVSFVGLTMDERNSTEEDMKEQVDYICRQVEYNEARTTSVVELLENSGVDVGAIADENMSELVKYLSFETLFDGYTVERDGLLMLTSNTKDEKFNPTVFASNDKTLQPGMFLAETMGTTAISTIEKSLQSGRMERAVFIRFDPTTLVDEASVDSFNVETNLSFFYSQHVKGYDVTMIVPTESAFVSRSASMLWISLSALVLLLAVFFLTRFLLNYMVIGRIDETNNVLERITSGDLDARVDVRRTREFSSLTDGINTTVDAMKGWIAEAETRMDAELAAAKAIQESALPGIFPPYPDILKFDIYASMNPAREVGGDFYDFFLLGNSTTDAGKLGFVIADVSGKGVPAALFMMKAKTQIRDYIESGMELGEALENTNRQLCDGNDSGMFVTVWAGVLDYETGHIDFVNAGHNPPLIWQSYPDQEDTDEPGRKGAWRWLKEKSGLPLGLFDGLPYRAHSVDCRIGDTLLLYTDGVTEAMSTSEELYGEERLEQLVNEHYTLHPRALVDAVRHSVSVHAEGAEQSDDITILALEVGVPPEITVTLTVPALLEELPHVNNFIHAELDRRLCPKRTQNQLDIAVEELFVNVAHYAYPDATPDNPGSVRVSYTYSAEPPSIRVDISDDGIPYNPLDKPDAVTPSDIMQVPIGGLGILMAKRSVDEMRYERVDDANVVTIIKKW